MTQQQWQFEQDAEARWRWKHVDDTETEIGSADSFATQVDCMLDAVRFAVQRRRDEAGMSEDDRLQ
ncbi:MAG TPA: hypothetical protein VED01_16695 [Burkholderiales bacterium]|nr:hypothetical protein [Burkholderiales bacterium]